MDGSDWSTFLDTPHKNQENLQGPKNPGKDPENKSEKGPERTSWKNQEIIPRGKKMRKALKEIPGKGQEKDPDKGRRRTPEKGPEKTCREMPRGKT